MAIGKGKVLVDTHIHHTGAGLSGPPVGGNFNPVASRARNGVGAAVALMTAIFDVLSPEQRKAAAVLYAHYVEDMPSVEFEHESREFIAKRLKELAGE